MDLTPTAEPCLGAAVGSCFPAPMPRLGDLELGHAPRIIAAATDRDFTDTRWCALADAIELRADEFADPSAAAVAATCALLAMSQP